MITPEERLRLIPSTKDDSIDPALVAEMENHLLDLIELKATEAISKSPARTEWYVYMHPKAHFGKHRWVDYKWIDRGKLHDMLIAKYPDWAWFDLRLTDHSLSAGWWSWEISVKVRVKS